MKNSLVDRLYVYTVCNFYNIRFSNLAKKMLLTLVLNKDLKNKTIK